jgi:hypothetical protein
VNHFPPGTLTEVVAAAVVVVVVVEGCEGRDEERDTFTVSSIIVAEVGLRVQGQGEGLT